MTKPEQKLYAREPLRWEADIPVFSERNAYVDNYDAIAGDHLKEYNKTGTNPFMPSDLVEELESETAALVGKYHPAGGTILDVGVGMGSLLSRCQSQPAGGKFGLDVSIEYLKIAKSRQIEVACAMVEDMPYQQGFFDTVVTTDVLEHVVDLNFCCGKILSVLKPGGHLVLRVPQSENLAPYLDPALPYDLVHLRGFDEPGLRLLFEKLFQCRFVEASSSGHLPDAVRLKPEFALASSSGEAAAFGGELRNSGNRELYLRYAHIFFRPIEINIVFRKTERTDAAFGYELSGSGRSEPAGLDQARVLQALRKVESDLDARELEVAKLRQELEEERKRWRNPLVVGRRLMDLILRKA